MIRKRRVAIVVLLILVSIFSIRNMIVKREFKSLKKVIVIDAGHGGSDPGAIGFSGSHEKNINLEIAVKLKDELKSKGFKVYLTRENDDFVENVIRAELANKKRARIFISIHGNSIKNNSTVNGAQVLFYSERTSTIGDPDSQVLANSILNAIVKGTGSKDMGIIERNDLVVLNQTKMPAVLIECGFMSNENEEKLLLNEDYQNKLVLSIISGLEEYFYQNK